MIEIITEYSMVLSICVVALCMLVIVAIKYWWPGCYKDDNAIENGIEDIIEKKSGIKIDLTPDSPEAPGRWEKK